MATGSYLIYCREERFSQPDIVIITPRLFQEYDEIDDPGGDEIRNYFDND